MCWINNNYKLPLDEQNMFYTVKENIPCTKLINEDSTPFFEYNSRITYQRGTLYKYLPNLKIISQKNPYTNKDTLCIFQGFHSYEDVQTLESNVKSYNRKLSNKIVNFIIPKGTTASILGDCNTQVSNQLIYPFSKWKQWLRGLFGLNPLYNKVVTTIV